MSMLLHPSARRRAPRPRFVDETALPILVGALAGSSVGLLIWGLAVVRFGVSGWFWP